MPSPHNKFSYRFSLDRNAEGRWEITDHERNEVEELISDEEVWLADRLEVMEETAARNHREVMRLKKVLRDRGDTNDDGLPKCDGTCLSEAERVEAGIAAK